MKLSVAVLAYNESVSLRVLLPALHDTCERLAHSDFELWVIDDASTDSTAQVVEDMKQALPQLRNLRHEINQGYAYATRSAIRAATGDVVIIMDGDGQHTPDQVERIFERFSESDSQVIFPNRTVRAEPLQRRVASRVLTTQCRWLLGFPGKDINGGIKGIRQTVSSKIEIKHQANLVNPEIWVRCHNESLLFEFVSIEQKTRIDGTESRAIKKPTAMLKSVILYILALRRELT